MNTNERLIEFRGGPSRSGAARIRVTLDSRGVFNLNTIAVRKLDNAEAVTFYYDVYKRVIGMKPAEIWRTNAFPVRVLNKMKIRTICAIAFCKHFDIKVTRTIEFNNAKVGEDGVLRLDLNDITVIGKEPGSAPLKSVKQTPFM